MDVIITPIKSEFREIAREFGINQIAILVPVRFYRIILKNILVYEYDRLKELELIFLKLVTEGIRDNVLIGQILGGLNEEAVEEIARSLEKQKLIKSEVLSWAKIKDYWFELMNEKMVPEELISELIKRKSGDSVKMYSVTSEGMYSIEKKIIRYKVPARYVELVIEPSLKLVVDFRYSLTSGPQIDLRRKVLSESAENTLGIALLEVLRDPTLRGEWLIPEDIAEPMDTAEVISIMCENQYHVAVLSPNKTIDKVYPFVPRSKDYRSFRKIHTLSSKNWRKNVLPRIQESIKTQVQDAMCAIEDFLEKREKISGSIVARVPFFGGKFDIPLLKEEIEQIVDDNLYSMVRSVLSSNGIEMQISFPDFIVLFRGILIPKDKSIARDSIISYLSKKVVEENNEFIDEGFWRERMDEYKRLKEFWGEYIPDLDRLWNKVIDFLPSYFWSRGEYFSAYKLRMKEDMDV